MGRSRTLEILITGKDKISKTLRRITGSLKKWGVGALKVSGLVVGAFGAATVAVGALLKKQADLIDEQAKSAASLGITNEALGAMRDAAGYAGIPVEGLQTSLRKMAQGIADAADGSGEAKDALEALGLNADKLQKMKPEQAFTAIITELDKIPNGIKKTQLAMDLFGRSGAAMTNLTSKGLKQAQQDAEDLGIKLNTAQAGAVEAANDSWARVKIIYGDFLKYITAKVAPVITTIFTVAFEKLKELDLKAIGTNIAKGIGSGIVLILEGIERVGTAIVSWKIGLESIRLIFLQIQLGIWESLEGLRELNIAVREFDEKYNPLKVGARIAGGNFDNSGLEKSKQILAQQQTIIAQIKKDIDSSKSKGADLLGDHEKSQTALDGFIGKVEEAVGAIKQGATVTKEAEATKSVAINSTTSAIQRQIEAQRLLNEEQGKSGGSFSVSSFTKAIDDEADR